MKTTSCGLKEALRLTLEGINPLPTENVDLVDSVDCVAASDFFALVDSPYMDASMKDGYAVLCSGTVHASKENPVRLKVLGSMAAGGDRDIEVKPGTTVRVLTGARVPTGADAVVPEELVKKEGNDILIESVVKPGKDILPRGSDVSFGERVLWSGQQISAAMTGLLAAAGHSVVTVFRNPVVGIMGIGDEIVEQGRPLTEGKLYASNIITLAGWCNKYKMKTRMITVKDDYEAILSRLRVLSGETDVVITSGGAWTGDRDLVAKVLEGLGWKQVFHRIRIRPGKAVGFGMLDSKPVFILSGGPPSNLMGFLQIALPGLLTLSGHSDPGLPRITAVLASEIRGKDPGWTGFFYGTLEPGEGLPVFHPLKRRSRLASMAEATAVASIAEGRDNLPQGSVVYVQLLK
jgi:molybdopterin molybdotransferase